MSDRLEHDFIGKPVLGPCSKVTQPNAEPELCSASAYGSVVTGFEGMTPAFPGFVFLLRGLFSTALSLMLIWRCAISR